MKLTCFVRTDGLTTCRFKTSLNESLITLYVKAVLGVTLPFLHASIHPFYFCAALHVFWRCVRTAWGLLFAPALHLHQPFVAAWTGSNFCGWFIFLFQHTLSYLTGWLHVLMLILDSIRSRGLKDWDQSQLACTPNSWGHWVMQSSSGVFASLSSCSVCFTLSTWWVLFVVLLVLSNSWSDLCCSYRCSFYF